MGSFLDRFLDTLMPKSSIFHHNIGVIKWGHFGGRGPKMGSRMGKIMGFWSFLGNIDLGMLK